MWPCNIGPLLLGPEIDSDAVQLADGQAAVMECGCVGLENAFQMLDVVLLIIACCEG